MLLPITGPDPDAAKKAVAQAKAAAKKVKHERSDPNSKAGMKKETLLAITASKFDDFPEWYKQVRDDRSWFRVDGWGGEGGCPVPIVPSLLEVPCLGSLFACCVNLFRKTFADKFSEFSCRPACACFCIKTM